MRNGQATVTLPTGTSATYNSPDRFMGALGTGATNAYCVGMSGIYHYNGTAVVREESSADVQHITGTSASDVWAGGLRGVLRHYDGSAWSTVNLGQGSADIVGIVALAPTSVFVATVSTIYELTPGGWVQQAIPAGYSSTYQGGAFAISSSTLWMYRSP
ncbi:MAG: hypothetical protein NTU67_09180 [Gemmatimonadetes bacterium]|nr:hypothetical protein [Gemmatimonadota bacterium]